jgi:hypothetical protein
MAAMCDHSKILHGCSERKRKMESKSESSKPRSSNDQGLSVASHTMEKEVDYDSSPFALLNSLQIREIQEDAITLVTEHQLVCRVKASKKSSFLSLCVCRRAI